MDKKDYSFDSLDYFLNVVCGEFEDDQKTGVPYTDNEIETLYANETQALKELYGNF